MNFAPFLSLLINAIARAMAKHRKVRDLVLPMIVKAAAEGGLPDNDSRREWVVDYLITKQGMSESTARLLTEAGVALWKKIQKKAAKKKAK